MTGGKMSPDHSSSTPKQPNQTEVSPKGCSMKRIRKSPYSFSSLLVVVFTSQIELLRHYTKSHSTREESNFIDVPETSLKDVESTRQKQGYQSSNNNEKKKQTN